MGIYERLNEARRGGSGRTGAPVLEKPAGSVRRRLENARLDAQPRAAAQTTAEHDQQSGYRRTQALKAGMDLYRVYRDQARGYSLTQRIKNAQYLSQPDNARGYAQTQKIRQAQTEVQTPAEAQKKKAGLLETLGSSIAAGAARFDRNVANTLDFGVDLIKSANRLLSGDDAFASALLDPTIRTFTGWVNRTADAVEAEAAEKAGRYGKAGEIAGSVISGTTSAIPSAVMALLSGGVSTMASLPPQTAGALRSARAAAERLGQNPMFWNSIAQTLGSSYRENRSRGADEAQAALAAVLSSVGNSVIEVGGGVETLPKSIREGARPGWAILQSGVEEGLEELQQGPLEQLVNKAVYDRNAPWFSAADTAAVLNPRRGAAEFGYGAASGLLLGGAQRLGALAMDRVLQRIGQMRQEANLPKTGSTNSDTAAEQPRAIINSASTGLATEKSMEGGIENGRTQSGDAVLRSLGLVAGIRGGDSGVSEVGRISETDRAETGLGLYGGGSEPGIHLVDSEGRRIRADQAKQIRDTTATDGAGRPLALYHFTPELEFTVFDRGDTGFHFGSWEQAQQPNLPTVEQGDTAINDDPAQHTPAEQRVIEAYKSSTDEQMRGFIEKVRSLQSNDYKNKISADVHTETTRAADTAGRLTGTDTSGFKNIIKGNAVQHIDRRHGTNGSADHSMANIDDFSRIGFVLDHFTAAELLPVDRVDAETAKLSREWMNSDNTQAPLVRFYMPVNGVFYVVEAVPSSKAKRLAVVSAYISGENKEHPQASAEPV